MKFGFSELVLLAAIVLILFGPTVIPWVQGWLRRANQTQRQVQQRQQQIQKQMVQEGNAILHRFQVVTSVLLLGGAAVYLGYLMLHPAPCQPQRYTPDPAQMPLITAGSTQTTVLDLAPYEDPVCVVWQDGWLYAAVNGNQIIRVREDGTGLTPVFTSDSPIVSMAFAPDGSLYLAGTGAIYKANFDGWAVDVKPVLTQIDGMPLQMPTGLAVAGDGRVFFTQYARTGAETRTESFFTELVCRGGTGTVHVFDPADGTVQQLTGGLSGAGGLALSPDEATVYISETSARRVWAIPADARTLHIRDAGSVLLSGLNGYAAGLTRSEDGTIWTAICGEPVAWVDKMSAHPLPRQMVLNLPHLTQRWLLTPSADSGWAFAVDAEGQLQQAVAAQAGEMHGRITGICETKDWLWLANADGSQLYGIPR